MRDGVDRHADHCQRQNRRRAHRIDVADGVRRGDLAEMEGIIHHRHEKIGRGDQRLVVVQPIDRRIVRGFDPDQQFGRTGRAALPRNKPDRMPGAILQPQPPPWARDVRRGSGMSVWVMCIVPVAVVSGAT
ncbi:hypothetical protein MGSAQ_003080 [marine sediment metagenome]|uniref:Uncharacterized protein n=1 Tax=marine sediment metagenome TaxID=412755 RepID=A0A1B6NPS3_9ZZZZ